MYKYYKEIRGVFDVKCYFCIYFINFVFCGLMFVNIYFYIIWKSNFDNQIDEFLFFISYNSFSV